MGTELGKFALAFWIGVLVGIGGLFAQYHFSLNERMDELQKTCQDMRGTFLVTGTIARCIVDGEIASTFLQSQNKKRVDDNANQVAK